MLLAPGKGLSPGVRGGSSTGPVWPLQPVTSAPMRSGWLLRDGDVVCALEMTESLGERVKGLIGRERVEGGLHLEGARAVHTAGMKFPLDVAFLSEDLVVMRMVRMPPWRIALPRPGSRSVLQTEAGALERWGVRVADQLDIREVE